MKTNKSWNMLINIVALFAFLGTTPSVFAVGGAYTLNFAAAQPRTYAKLFPATTPPPALVNGTAFNPVAGAAFSNKVESLAPRDLVLGQIVIFEIKVTVNGDTAPEGGAIEINGGWSTELTQGTDFGYNPAYGVYSAFIDKGDSLHNDPLNNVSLSNSWVWAASKNNGANDEIQGSFRIEGLESGDEVILEVWLVLDSVLPPGASGNVQSRLISAQTVLGSTINTGNQTVPLLKVQDFETYASVGNRVWQDSLNSGVPGVQDVGESGLSGVMVQLYSVGAVTSLVETTSTGVDGFYIFTGLLPGNYLVQFYLPDSTYSFTTQDAGGDDALDSDADATSGQTAVFTLLAGQTDLTRDAGMTVEPTLVAISSFSAAVVDGVAVIQWETSAELGAVGFFLERWDAAQNGYVRVNAELIPAAMDSYDVQSYAVVDGEATAGATYSYRLLEMEVTGRINAYGPYTVTVGEAIDVVEELDEQGQLALPDADADGDGQTNAEELDAGTNPLDGVAPLAVTAMVQGNGHMVIKWTSVAGRSYTITRARTIGGAFETVASGIPSQGTESMAVLIDGADSAVYRVVAE